MTTRRALLKLATGTTAAVAFGPSFSQNRFCPKDQIEKIRIWNDYLMVEGQINAGKGPLSGGASGKLPQKVIKWEITCESVPKTPPEPPKPPPPPPKNGLFDPFLYWIGESWADDWFSVGRSDLMYFNVGLPAFVTIWASTARASLQATLMNGATAAHVAPLTVDGGGFKFANPGAVDQFLANIRGNALRGTLAVDSIDLGATTAGSGNFGIGAHYNGRPIFGSTGVVYAAQARERTVTRVNEY